MPAQNLRRLQQPFGDTGILTAQVEWGETVAVATRFPAGFDGADMVEGSGLDAFCPVPHWGFVLSGEIAVRYSDGREETARAGEAFYLPPGHLPFTAGGAEIIEFSPAEAMAEQWAKAAAAFGEGASQ
jgi:hypothetical protein